MDVARQWISDPDAVLINNPYGWDLAFSVGNKYVVKFLVEPEASMEYEILEQLYPLNGHEGYRFPKPVLRLDLVEDDVLEIIYSLHPRVEPLVYGDEPRPQPETMIVYEWIEGRRLTDDDRERPETKARLLKQVELVHQHGITHGDIHQLNVIVTDAGPNLIDWGQGMVLEDLVDEEDRTALKQHDLRQLDQMISDPYRDC